LKSSVNVRLILGIVDPLLVMMC